jgi:DegV family protein with EDD domain
VPSSHLSGLFNTAVQAAREVRGARVVVVDPADPARPAESAGRSPANNSGWSTDSGDAGWSTEGQDDGLLVLQSTSLNLEEQLAQLRQSAAPTVVVMNSDFVAGAIALMTIHALEAIAAGAPLDEIVRRMIVAKRGMGLYFILNKLDYVVDRVGQLQVFFGTLLHITPVMAIQNGLVQDVAKTRGGRKAKRRLLELVQAQAGERAIDAISLHSQAPEEAQELMAQLRSQVRVRNSWVSAIGCTVSRYTGRGGLGIAFTVV